MSILGALQTSVSGLSAQSYALENISGNIANASTVGFKRVDTSFTDLVADQPVGQELSGSVSASSQLTTGIAGGVNSTGVPTNVAISGSGFFVVSQNNGSTTSPSFSTTNLYTRRGDFSKDSQGYLVNGAGYYLDGTTYDPTTGAAVGISPSPIKISSAALAAQKTTTVDYSGNLPSQPQPTSYTGTAGTDLLTRNASYTAAAAYAAPGAATTVNFTVNGTAKTATINPTDTLATVVANLNTAAGSNVFSADSNGKIVVNGGGTSNVAIGSGSLSALGYTSATAPGTIPTSFSGADSASFVSDSISGGQVTVYSDTGTAENLQLRWAKVDSTATGGSDTWQLYYEKSSDASAATAWQSVGSPVTFSANGTTSTTTLTLSGVSLGGVSLGDITLDMSGGLTQYGDSSGAASVSLEQNGYTSGTLSSIAVGSDGTITGSYSNGQAKKLGQITVAQFAGADSLKSENGGAYSATTASGNPTYSLNGTTLTGGSVEGSNTDISSEFSKMIVTQQAYSANTKVMSTAQQMLSDIINIIR